MNEISQHPESMDTFLVETIAIFSRKITKMQSTFHKVQTNTIKKYFKKWPQNGPLSCYVAKRKSSLSRKVREADIPIGQARI